MAQAQASFDSAPAQQHTIAAWGMQSLLVKLMTSDVSRVRDFADIIQRRIPVLGIEAARNLMIDLKDISVLCAKETKEADNTKAQKTGIIALWEPVLDLRVALLAQWKGTAGFGPEGIVNNLSSYRAAVYDLAGSNCEAKLDKANNLGAVLDNQPI